jgi:xylan 1,4-beta-xylosidase
VAGASGYLVHRGESASGPWTPLDHGGGDVLAVPGTVYTDTLAEPGREHWYAVASVTSIEASGGEVSMAVMAAPAAGGDARVTVSVDAAFTTGPLHRPWRPIIGSEHLALLRRGRNEQGFDVGEELAEALRLAHVELGVEAVRAHGALLDELGVYREVDGQPVHDFTQLDAVYDRLLDIGLRPVVELSFMPRELASDPDATVFEYRAIISPPRDWDRWAALMRDLAQHLVDRYGIDAVAQWGFEVWNEPNLVVFWAGSQADYFRLYDETATAVKSVDERLLVGGPSTAAAGWVEDLLAHADESGSAVDFLSTHTYGSPPLDLRPIAEAHGKSGIPIWWTEWGISPTHFAIVNDGVFGAPLVASGMKVAAARGEALAYWVASDHFVELGEPPRLFHGGFGLLTVGNLHKPRWWVLAMLERLGDETAACRVEGDGAGALVDAWATRADDGRIAIAAWNGTLDQSKAAGAQALDRDLTVHIDGLQTGTRYTLRHHRLDATHSNILAVWERLGSPDWPDEVGWHALRDADRLEELEPAREVVVDGRSIDVAFTLPMPSVSLLELVPVP